ncbi:sushi, nidogen and EGF-like domain-containing protein 1 [Ascaphus truei]|uniref:sushi, nidogen and EGF-like domain-containing protein 1 n=1 Tax=Ascaphus truei TaxID=8439 RepID=UPI003F5A3685
MDLWIFLGLLLLDDSTADPTSDPIVAKNTEYVTQISHVFETTIQPTLFETDLLYPYGPAVDIINRKVDDGGSALITLSSRINLFGKVYNYLYVNNNGLLSFSTSIGTFTPSALPVTDGNPFLAPFWADVDNTRAGDIYYRQSTDPGILARATSDIRTHFCVLHFSARWVFVATWHKVGFYGSQSSSKVNTFQAVLSTDGNLTFILFNYADIQWTTGTASGGIPALAGLNSGYSTDYYSIPGSMSPAILNVSSTSNVNVTGRWAFRADQLKSADFCGRCNVH